jgi:hypothetical protein
MTPPSGRFAGIRILAHAEAAINGRLAARLSRTRSEMQSSTFIGGGVDHAGSSPHPCEAGTPVAGQLP